MCQLDAMQCVIVATRCRPSDDVGREAADSASAATLRAGGRGRTTSVQPITDGLRQVRTGPGSDHRPRRKEPDTHHQRLEQIRKRCYNTVY